MKPCLLLLLFLTLTTFAYAQDRYVEEIMRFESVDARQGLAVDDQFVYVVSNHSISKHNKETGELVLRWEGEEGEPLIHLNSGIVFDGVLYCAHSNYPSVPMTSSIEMFDTETLEHIGSHSFGIMHGSATWIDQREDMWWIGFAHYEGRGGIPDQGPTWTRIMIFDKTWRVVGGYVFPEQVTDRFLDRSNSGAAFGPDGLLYATGHDAAEVYVLDIPEGGSTLDLVEIVPVPAEGQGIAWDRTNPGVLYTIIKAERTVIASKMKVDTP